MAKRIINTILYTDHSCGIMRDWLITVKINCRNRQIDLLAFTNCQHFALTAFRKARHPNYQPHQIVPGSPDEN